MNGDIFIIKIGQKSGNPSADFLHIRGSGMRCIIPSSEECIFQSVRQSFHTKLESLIMECGGKVTHPCDTIWVETGGKVNAK